MKKSAGILVYRERPQPEVLLVHPGGPFFKNKDLGSWTIPKGEINEGENALDAAKREFFEETGVRLTGPFYELKPIKQKSGKVVLAWAILQEIDDTKIVSNFFELEWPPKTGRIQKFPEIDKASWFDFEVAKQKILPAQIPLLDELSAVLNVQ